MTTRLAARIREQGVSVYGFGNRTNTHRALVAACNDFIYFDALPVQVEESTSLRHQPSSAPRAFFHVQPFASPSFLHHTPSTFAVPRPLDQTALDGLRKAVHESSVYEEDYTNLAEFGAYLVKLSPDLNARNHGFAHLKDFVLASKIVDLEIKERENGSVEAQIHGYSPL